MRRDRVGKEEGGRAGERESLIARGRGKKGIERVEGGRGGGE